MSILKFRNVDVSPDDPVETWGFEGVLAAIERRDIEDWSRLAAAFRAEPLGHVAAQVAEAVEVADAPGAVALLSRALSDARTSQQG